MVKSFGRLQENIQTLRNNLRDIVILVLLVFVVFNYFKPSKQVFPVSKQKTIERRIEGKETVIKLNTVASDNGKKVIKTLNGRVDELMAELSIIKGRRDTFNIVPIQDTLIRILYVQGQVKDGVIKNLDTIVQAQRYIINSKDTIIATKDFELKKTKRQRNISLLVNGVLTTLLIIK
jgi:hypothetical protein